jgi:N-acetylmuramoyl-L-alanine amidase
MDESSMSPYLSNQKTMTTWLIDTGHGSDTPGKRAGDLLEWDFNRRVGKFLTYELDSLHIPYHILVPEDHDIPLRIRSLRANKYAQEHGDCKLLSIHGNAFHGSEVTGIETWYYSHTGRTMAKVFQKDLIDILEWKDRGLKEGSFWIIKETVMPAVLVELGFYTNPDERARMLDAENQYWMGVSLALSIQALSK